MINRPILKVLIFSIIIVNIRCQSSNTLPYSNCNSEEVSKLFYKQNNIGSDTFKIVDKNVFNQNKQQVYFPLDLEICKVYKYETNKNGNIYSLLVKRINLSDIIFKYTNSFE